MKKSTDTKSSKMEKDTPRMLESKFSRKDWWFVGLILLATFLVFSPALKADFVDWDDDENITENTSILEINRENLRTIFTTPITGGYTPLTSLTFAIENQFFGLKPGVFHLNNLFLHLLVTLLVFIFLRKLGIGRIPSFLVMILFAIHPMRVESVAWITERKDVLYSLFYFLSLIAYIAYYKSRRTLFYALALLAFIPALFSKIQSVSLPLVLILLDYWFEGKFTLRQIRNKVPFLLLSLITGSAGLYILWKGGTMDTGTVLAFTERIFIGTYTFCVYLLKSLVPWQLSAIYPYPSELSFLHYLSAPVALLILYGFYRVGRQNRIVAFGFLFFLVNVMFMLQIVGAGQAYMADRFTYVPYLGLFLIFGYYLEKPILGIGGARRFRSPVIAGVVIYILLLAGLSLKHTRVWMNTETLFSDVVRKFPQSAMAHNNLGVYYRNQRQYDQAIASYGKALKLNPSAHVIHNNRGEVYFEIGETDRALEDMNAAIRLDPGYVKALTNRGALWGSKNEFSRALEDLDQAVKLDPRNLSAYSNRILVHFSMGNYGLAVQDADSYLDIKPDDGDIHNIRGLCNMRLNKFTDALADFNRSIEINPRAGSYFQNRSTLYFNMGRYPEALNDIRKAQELGTKPKPGYPELLEKRIAESVR